MSTKTIKLTDEQGNLMLPENAESGSGYIKFADGTQICWGTVTAASVNPNTTVDQSINFEKSFINPPKCVAVPNGYVLSGDRRLHDASVLRVTTNAVTVRFANYYNTAGTINADYFAIGRWK